MPKVGIRQLKNDASEIIRAVREERTEYIVTYRGEPVAMIVPVAERIDETGVVIERPDAAFWEELANLRKEIEANWKSEKTAVELVEEQRRQL